jgi:hypothetical protein
MKRAKPKAPKLTAAQLARQEVHAWFEAVIEEQETLIGGDGNQPLERLSAVFENVVKILESEEDEPITDATDNWVTSNIGVRAGYLIGVQIGLRLRNVGGGA